MRRLYILVEGQSEEEFVKRVLAPHLQPFGLWVTTFIVETSRNAFGHRRRGGGHWKHWLRDLKALSGQWDPEVRFTTLFDLYGLPEDFPGLAVHGNDPDTVRRASALENAMADAIGDHRLIPYLQRHEFEALVLAALDELEDLLDETSELEGLSKLKSEVAASAPEEINDGQNSAPSKRLQSLIPSYRKTGHGPLVLESAGLPKLRSRCPRFDRWLTQLEALDRPSDATPSASP